MASKLRLSAYLGAALLLGFALAAHAATRGRHHSPPRHFVQRALPYNARVVPMYTAYTPPGTVFAGVSASQPEPPFCAGTFLALGAPLPRRVWQWSLRYSFAIYPAAPERVRTTRRLARAVCQRVGPLMRALSTNKQTRIDVFGHRASFREWTCDVATSAVTCKSRRGDGAYVVHVSPSTMPARPPVHAGAAVQFAGVGGQSQFATTDYYELSLDGLIEPFAPPPPFAVEYFLVIGQHACGVSAAATERAMTVSGGVILAITARSVRPLAQPLYLRLPIRPTYRACLFLQRTGSDGRATALIETAF